MDLTITPVADGDWQILSVAGELDLFSYPVLRDAVHQISAPAVKIALDLSDVTFVDSTGLGAVVSCLQHVREGQGAFAVVAAEGTPLTRLLALTGLDQVLTALPDRRSLGTP